MVHKDKKSQETWDKMGFFMPLPGFNSDNFPFLIISGNSSIAVLNAKTCYFEPIIFTSASLSYSQQAFFFQKADFGLKLNIATRRNLLNGNKRLQWIQMDIKPQLLETLKRIGELPVSKMKKLIKIQAEYVEYQAAKKLGIY